MKLAIILVVAFLSSSRSTNHTVKVFFYIMFPQWGAAVVGNQNCPSGVTCDWSTSIHIHEHSKVLQNLQREAKDDSLISVAVYNIHSLYQKTRLRHPLNCELPVNLTMATSVESFVRYGPILFDAGFPHFDGNSTTHPQSSVQRFYPEAILNETSLQQITQNFSSLIKAGSFVASDCHGGDGANANRNGVIHEIRQAGFRVDGLGKCMRSIGPEGVTLPNLRNTILNLQLKRQTIGRFMFNMAFENSIEPGYVTEKPFDALIAGTVPVYLGDAAHLKSLLPHPKAAIFVDDFGNIPELAKYLTYLTTNETAYEEHRAWRKDFNGDRNLRDKPLLQTSWPCKVCDWAVDTVRKNPHVVYNSGTKCRRTNSSTTHTNSINADANNANVNANANTSRRPLAFQLNGKAIKGSARDVFLVVNNTRRPITTMDTFFALKLRLSDVKLLSDSEVAAIPLGEPVILPKPISPAVPAPAVIQHPRVT